MAALDVVQLLDSLREHGTIDSQGEFTISLAEARRKLTEFRSSNRRRYLLLLVSAGLGAGASRARIQKEGSSYHLTFPDAYLHESSLLGSFANPSQQSRNAAALDLILGLQAAFAEGVNSVVVEALDQARGSYRWSLKGNSESSKPLTAANDTSLSIKLRFQESWVGRLEGLLQGFGGYAGQPEELRLLEQCCERSDVAILVDDKPLCRPTFLKPARVTARIGDCRNEQASGRTPYRIKAEGWRGLVGLGDGQLWVIVRGATLGHVVRGGLHGVVHNDSLTLDLAREGLVIDGRYQDFLDQLTACRSELIERALQDPDEMTAETQRHLLGEAVEVGLRGGLSVPGTEALARKIAVVVDGSEKLEDWNAEFSLTPLVRLVRRLQKRADYQDIVELDQVLLERCAEALNQRSPDVPKLFRLTIRTLQILSPNETLMPGYLYLGLGAFYSATGYEKDAQRQWMKALDLVRAGSDDRAEELIHAHMDFPVDHTMSQVSSAVSLYRKVKP